jgi:hypothetical protein
MKCSKMNGGYIMMQTNGSIALRIAGGVAVLCLAGTVGACGNKTDGAGSAATPASASATGSTVTSAAAGGLASADVKHLVLTAAELPAGYSAVPVDDATLQKVLKEITGAGSTAKFSPAACGSPAMFAKASNIDIKALGVMAAQGGSDVLSESVTAERPDLAAVKKNITGQCSDVTAQITTMGQNVTTHVKYSPVTVSKTKADEIFAVRQETVSKVAGQTVDQQAYAAYARVGSYAVVVQLMGMGAAPDRATFDKVVVSAVNKVAAEK